MTHALVSVKKNKDFNLFLSYVESHNFTDGVAFFLNIDNSIMQIRYCPNCGRLLEKHKFIFKHSEDDDIYEDEIEAYSYDDAYNKVIDRYDDAWIVCHDDDGSLG